MKLTRGRLVLIDFECQLDGCDLDSPMSDTPLGESVKVLPEMFIWGKMTHPRSGKHFPVDSPYGGGLRQHEPAFTSWASAICYCCCCCHPLLQAVSRFFVLHTNMDSTQGTLQRTSRFPVPHFEPQPVYSVRLILLQGDSSFCPNMFWGFRWTSHSQEWHQLSSRCLSYSAPVAADWTAQATETKPPRSRDWQPRARCL